MMHVLYIFGLLGMLLVLTTAMYRAYVTAFKRWSGADDLDQLQQKRLRNEISRKHISAAVLAFVCLMPVVALPYVWGLANKPLKMWGLAALVALLAAGQKFVLKIGWLVIFLRDQLTPSGCVVLSLLGLFAVLVFAPLVQHPHDLLEIIKAPKK